MIKEGRRSFFEKKEPKKLLLRLACVSHRPVEDQINKVFFAAFLFTKKKCFL
jgi:hypothetical protein